MPFEASHTLAKRKKLLPGEAFAAVCQLKWQQLGRRTVDRTVNRKDRNRRIQSCRLFQLVDHLTWLSRPLLFVSTLLFLAVVCVQAGSVTKPVQINITFPYGEPTSGVSFSMVFKDDNLKSTEHRWAVANGTGTYSTTVTFNCDEYGTVRFSHIRMTLEISLVDLAEGAQRVAEMEAP